MSISDKHTEQIESAYIITVNSSKTSVRMSDHLHKSCKNYGMNVSIWNAVDGLGDTILLPKHLQNQISMSLVCSRNNAMTNAEVACFLSHYSLWCHCIKINKPICIFEHDAVIVKPITEHHIRNAIQFLGCKSQLSSDNFAYTRSAKNTNYFFMKGTHAYTIDPLVAKNMVSYVIKEGITKPLDIIMRDDIFTTYQYDIYAHETDEITDGIFLNSVSTIIGQRRQFEEPRFDYS